jgi:Viral coat protein (S domain).
MVRTRSAARKRNSDFVTPPLNRNPRPPVRAARRLDFDPDGPPDDSAVDLGFYPMNRPRGINTYRRMRIGPARRLAKWDNSSKIPRYHGRGDYRTTLNSIGKAIQSAGRAVVPGGTFQRFGGLLGGAAGMGLSGGNPYAGVAGTALGQGAGSKFAQLVGFGDYQVKANTLVKELDMGSQVAAFGNLSQATIVKHREFITDIAVPAVPGDFTTLQLSLNPGLANVFPWLSTIASNFQEYEFLGCVFEYKSTSSDTATGLALGSVVMSSNYDTAEDNYHDKREAENSQYCTSAKPSVDFAHPIECDPSVTFVPIKYIRTGAVPTGKDSRLYDHVNVQVSTVGLPVGTTGNIGELWVSYEVALLKPILGQAVTAMDHYNVVPSLANEMGVLFASTLPIGGITEGLGTTLTSSRQITLPAGTPAGKYIFEYIWRSSAAPALPITFVPTFTLSASLIPVNFLIIKLLIWRKL